MIPELSIVIAVRDNWKQLAHCLDSIAAQNLPPRLEVLVIDDGSKAPPTAEFAESIGDTPVRLHRQTGLGIAAARNRGVQFSKGEVIVFVDSDCLLDPHCLQKLGEATRRHPDDVAFQFQICSTEKTLVHRIEALRLRTVQEAFRLESGHISYANTSGFAVRSAYTREWDDFFDVSVVRGEDTVMLAQLLHQGWKPRFLPQCKVFHCPGMPFLKYALKRYSVGYHDSYSRQLRQAAEGLRLNWRKKIQIMRRTWSGSVHSRKNVLCAGSALLCFAIEKFGHAVSRRFAVRPGERKLLGVRLNVVRQTEVIYHIATHAERRRGFWVTYVNAWTLVQARKSARFRSALDAADVCYVSGVGVKLAALLLVQPRVRKVIANNFILDLCRELANRNLTVALVGGEAAVVRKASDIISRAAPKLEITLRSPGFFSPAEEASLTAELIRRQPHVLIIGMGQPRQEEWAAKIRPLLPNTVLFCVGGLFDYLTGPRKCADFARRFNLE
jgi:exopolysaccharide biosynthesis WecB/TagA/CpsF family protein